MSFRPVDLGNAELNRFVNGLLAELDTDPPMWWYLSFVDPAKAAPPDQQQPGGPGWLGACYVKAPNEVMAVRQAHLLGCNPGGEVAMWGPFPDHHIEANVPPEQRCRLLDRTDLDIPDPE